VSAEYSLLGISYLPRKMEPTLSSETSAYKIQTPGKFPEDYTLHNESYLTRSCNTKSEFCNTVVDWPVRFLLF
jgi:hypothetical protein